MVETWFYGISLVLFVKLYVIDISMNIIPLVNNAFDREGGDNGIREFKMEKKFQTKFSNLSFPKTIIRNHITWLILKVGWRHWLEKPSHY